VLAIADRRIGTIERWDVIDQSHSESSRVPSSSPTTEASPARGASSCRQTTSSTPRPSGVGSSSRTACVRSSNPAFPQSGRAHTRSHCSDEKEHVMRMSW
jgi:hypothetical protein